MDRTIRVAADPADLARQAANAFVEAAKDAVSAKGRFTVALSGGSTPEALFKLLADEPYRSAVDWPKVEVFWGDERCVPPDSAQSNYKTAHDLLLSKVPVPAGQVHHMRGEIDPNEAAKEYGLLLKQTFGDGGLDLVLLGMGDDGHTASLFPGTAALNEREHRCVANRVEKLNAWRITLTAPFINKADQVILLVGGEKKAERLREVLEGPRDPDRLPVQLIEPRQGKLVWLLDAAAAGMNDDD